jgi:hypothetical protein
LQVNAVKESTSPNNSADEEFAPHEEIKTGDTVELDIKTKKK